MTELEIRQANSQWSDEELRRRILAGESIARVVGLLRLINAWGGYTDFDANLMRGWLFTWAEGRAKVAQLVYPIPEGFPSWVVEYFAGAYRWVTTRHLYREELAEMDARGDLENYVDHLFKSYEPFRTGMRRKETTKIRLQSVARVMERLGMGTLSLPSTKADRGGPLDPPLPPTGITPAHLSPPMRLTADGGEE